MRTRRLLVGVALAATLAACSGSSAKTTVATTSGVADGPTTTALAGTTFTDPDGTYTIVVDPDWSEQSGASPQKDIEVWQAAPSVDGFAANVNILTQEAKGASLTDYLDASVKQLEGLTVNSSSVVDVGGRKLGEIEYSGKLPGATLPLHFLAVVDVGDDRAVLATFTATEAAFASLRPTIERYLLTLRRT